jgi:hypothetical protein
MIVSVWRVKESCSASRVASDEQTEKDSPTGLSSVLDHKVP